MACLKKNGYSSVTRGKKVEVAEIQLICDLIVQEDSWTHIQQVSCFKALCVMCNHEISNENVNLALVFLSISFKPHNKGNMKIFMMMSVIPVRYYFIEAKLTKLP